MTRKKLEKYRIRIAILLALNYIGVVLGVTFCLYYTFYVDTVFILYGILILIFYLFTTAVLESLHFLLEERIYGEKKLEEDNNNQNKKLETKENSTTDK